MGQNETSNGIGSRQALVPLQQPTPSSRRVGGRPLSGFLTQLIVGSEPALRPGRTERTRIAAAIYRAQAARED